MRLVFVHGMRQEGQDPHVLRAAWLTALQRGWSAAGLAPLSVDPEMPFYGDELDRLTRELAMPGGTIQRGGASEPSATERALMREFAIANDIGEAEIRAELVDAEVINRGPANWAWVQATARALENRIPGFRTLGVRLVQQVDAYLNRPHITQAVDAIVSRTLSGDPAVVVAHSLGTIVTYRLLRAAEHSFRTPLIVTLGSPLGINAVRDRIRPPQLAVPDGVGHWLNVADKRDYVALYPMLDGSSFTGGIENLVDIHNGHADPHAITDYLTDARIGCAIHTALTKGPGQCWT